MQTITESIHLTVSSELLKRAYEQRLCNSHMAIFYHQPASLRNTVTPKLHSVPRKFPGMALTYYSRAMTEDIKKSLPLSDAQQK